jgi:hypothetical protein
MPETRLKCPSCEAVLKLSAPLVHGKAIKCPKCGATIRAPATPCKSGGPGAVTRPAPRPQPVRKARPEEEAEDLDDEEETVPRPRKGTRREADEGDEELHRRKRKKKRDQDEDGSRKKLLWIGLGGGATLLVGVVVLVFLLKGSGGGGGDGKKDDEKSGQRAGGASDDTKKEKADGKKDDARGDEKVAGGFAIRQTDSFNTGANNPAVNIGMAVSRDGKTAVVASGDPKKVKIFDVQAKMQRAAFEPTLPGRYTAAISPDNTWLACYMPNVTGQLRDNDTSIELRTLKDGALVRELKPERIDFRALQHVTFSPQSDLVVARDVRNVFGWDCKSGEQRFMLKPHEEQLIGLAFLPDGRMVTSGRDRTMKIWDLTTYKAIKTIQLEGSYANLLAVSPDGKLAASMEYKKDPGVKVYGETVFTWNLETGTKVSQMRRDGWNNYSNMRFLADNKTLVISQRSSLECWDAVKGKCVYRLQGEPERRLPMEEEVDGTAVAENGTLFMLRRNGTLQLWEVKE